MENKKYLVEIYGSHDLFARNEREARKKAIDWLQQHWCFMSCDIQEFDAPPKEGSLAARQMKNIPLKRKNIFIKNVFIYENNAGIQSECPTCGRILYEKCDNVFDYCPWCAQALDNNDFSEEE